MPFKFTYNNLPIVAGEFTLSRGIEPSIATLRVLPEDLPTLTVGSMVITDGTNTVTFTNCAVDYATIRRVPVDGGWRWHLQVKDRRWKWKGGKITGRYNVRKANGEVIASTQKEPFELFTLLFAAMGETNGNFVDLPTGFYPFVDWNLADPAIELLKLCERFGFAICLTTLDTVNITPYGVGNDLVPGLFGGEITGMWRVEPDTLPAKVVVTAGPTRYQRRMALEAVDIDDDNDLKPVDDLANKPAGGWDNDYPHFFSQVAAADRWRAYRGTWRYFRVNAFVVPIILETAMMTSGQDEDGNWGRLPPMLDGVFFNYSELPLNAATGTAWNGNFTIFPETQVVVLDTPTFYLGSGGVVQEPTLYLTTAYYLWNNVGMTSLDHLEAEVAIAGGTGSHRYVRFPEAFAGVTIAQTYPVAIAASNNILAITAELEAIRDSFALRYDTLRLWAMEYNGVQHAYPDGKIAQVSWRGWCGKAGTTSASQGFEFDVFNESDAVRNRRSLVGGLVEDFYVSATG